MKQARLPAKAPEVRSRSAEALWSERQLGRSAEEGEPYSVCSTELLRSSAAVFAAVISDARARRATFTAE